MVVTAKALGCVGGRKSTMVTSVSRVGPGPASTGIEGIGERVSEGSLDGFVGFWRSGDAGVGATSAPSTGAGASEAGSVGWASGRGAGGRGV